MADNPESKRADAADGRAMAGLRGRRELIRRLAAAAAAPVVVAAVAGAPRSADAGSEPP